jgi:hypothetical protein
VVDQMTSATMRPDHRFFGLVLTTVVVDGRSDIGQNAVQNVVKVCRLDVLNALVAIAQTFNRRLNRSALKRPCVMALGW